LIVLRFGGADFTRVRFAISPLVEVHASLAALDEPARAELHLPWIATAPSRLESLDLDLLKAVQPPGTTAPDFVHPPPRSPVTTLEDELEEMLATPPERVRAELRRAYLPFPVPPILNPLMDQTPQALAHLAEVIREYWQRVLEPHWDRIHSVLEGDILFRARQMADSGLGPPLADLHEQVRIEDDVLVIDRLADVTCDLGGRGLLLVPSVFTWPHLGALIDPPCQPTLVYPARGVGLVWEGQASTTPGALEELIGRRRAAVLAELDVPRSTTELARRLGLSAPSVSQHLSILRQAAVVRAHRVGRMVLYSRTPSGDALLLGADPGRTSVLGRS
jgi:DNA-binding transcriptional ArsR family regulator